MRSLFQHQSSFIVPFLVKTFAFQAKKTSVLEGKREGWVEKKE
jgi:hypothetical protein